MTSPITFAFHISELRWRRICPLSRNGEVPRVPITPAFEVNDTLSLREVAMMGSGITLLPSYIVIDEPAAGH